MTSSQHQIDFLSAGFTYTDGSKSVEACRDLNLFIDDGQSVAFIGPSGCGKSTTLLMAAGLIQPTQGEVLVNGAPLRKPRKETAFIPQDLGLFPWKTVIQNAALGLRFHGVTKDDAEQQAREALAIVNLSGFEDAYPKELSGGMRQRLALARALTVDADILLMDEPLSAIDALLRESLQEMLLSLWKTRHHTQLLVTHSIEEAVYLGGRILVFSDRPGTVVVSISNPHIGEDGWRDSAEFAKLCRTVREALNTCASKSDAAEERKEVLQ